MFAAIFAVIIRGSFEVGGVREVFRIATERGRIEFFNLSVDPTARHTLWTQIIGGMFVYCSIYAVNQVRSRYMEEKFQNKNHIQSRLKSRGSSLWEP